MFLYPVLYQNGEKKRLIWIPIDQFGFKNVISLRPPYLGGGGGGLPRAYTKEEYFKLCPALVQEMCTPGSLHHILFSLKPPRYGGPHILETELVYSFQGPLGPWTLKGLVFALMQEVCCLHKILCAPSICKILDPPLLVQSVGSMIYRYVCEVKPRSEQQWRLKVSHFVHKRNIRNVHFGLNRRVWLTERVFFSKTLITQTRCLQLSAD